MRQSNVREVYEHAQLGMHAAKPLDLTIWRTRARIVYPNLYETPKPPLGYRQPTL